MARSRNKPLFSVGDAVRVRAGVADPDYPDIPIGGWSGTIREAEEGTPAAYLVRWSKKTLDGIQPVYRKRCERDGLDFHEMWLDQDNLEPDSGAVTDIEQPTSIKTRPLSEDDQDDRIRAVFDLTSDDPLPGVDDTSLSAYFWHLASHLSFPFEADWSSESGMGGGEVRAVTVLGLGDAGGDPWIVEMYGLLCRARLRRRNVGLPLGELEVKGKGPNRQLVRDYCYWFWNWR